jgi:hypothetical protein
MRQRGLLTLAALCALLLGFNVSTLHAQSAHVGAHTGYNFDRDHGLVGAQLLIPVARHLELYPSFDYYFGTGPNRLGFSGDVKYRVPLDYGSDAYLGGGLNVLNTSGSGVEGTDAGWDVIFGWESRRGGTHPFVEGRLLQHGASQFQVLAGLNITLQ